MGPKEDINVNIIEPKNYEELELRYAEAVFKIIKNRISPEFINYVIEKLQQNNKEEIHRWR